MPFAGPESLGDSPADWLGDWLGVGWLVGSLGCVVLGIFQVPNKFFEDGGRIADVLGQDWDAAWGGAGNLRAAG